MGILKFIQIMTTIIGELYIVLGIVAGIVWVLG